MASEWMAGLKRDDFAADTEIGSDLVSAADTEIGSDAVSAADFGSAAMQSSLPIQKSAAT